MKAIHLKTIFSKQIIFLFLLIAILGGIYIRFSWKRIENQQVGNALQVARNIEDMLPKVDFKSIAERPGEIDNPNYQLIHSALQRVAVINTQVRFAYIYIELNNKVFFIADSEPTDSEDFSPPGQEYTEVKAEDTQPFRDGKELVTPSLSDRWGTWRSALVPIKDQTTGKTIAILGLDYDAKSWNRILFFHVVESSTLIALLVFVLLLFIIIKRKNNSLQNEINERLKLKKTTLMLAHAVRSISDCVCITDMKDKVLFVNNAFMETYQLQEHELLGQQIDIIRSPNNPPALLKAIYTATLSGGWRGELLNKKKDGSEFPVFLSTSVIHSDRGESVALIGVATDITERKKAETILQNARLEAEAANKAKSVFLANMSHEIRTPLNAIIGFSQLMNRDKHLTPTQKDYNISIIRAGEHLLALINDILELSKMEAGRLELNPLNIDLHLLFADINMFFREQARSKHLQFIFETAVDMPQYVIVDDNKLRRIFINLIGNALKFTDEGGVAVRIRMDKLNDRQSFLVVEIQDSGPGIPEEEIDKLFKHFVQTSTGINNSSGTGLGLALSRELAILMGGDIKVSSEVEKGTIFTFNVNVEIGESETSFDNGRKGVIGYEKPEENYRILVVDDKEENLHVAVKLLSLVGFDTKEAVNGEDAIAKFETWNPHLILMDMRMPVMDGYEATRLIKSTVKGQFVPIVALTASSFEDERRKTIAIGMQGYIRKPFRESELFGTIGSILNIKYIYEDESTFPEDKYEISDTEITEHIATLPRELVVQMQNAAAAADIDFLIELIQSIEPKNSVFAQHLMGLANNYEYQYLQQILNKKEIE
jgi:PAS domain S-box-containing protein